MLAQVDVGDLLVVTIPAACAVLAATLPALISTHRSTKRTESSAMRIEEKLTNGDEKSIAESVHTIETIAQTVQTKQAEHLRRTDELASRVMQVANETSAVSNKLDQHIEENVTLAEWVKAQMLAETIESEPGAEKRGVSPKAPRRRTRD